MSGNTIERLVACLWSSEQRNERLRAELADLAQTLEGATKPTELDSDDSDDSRIATVRDCLLRDGEELRQSLALDALDGIELELESLRRKNERLQEGRRERRRNETR